jgi:hypothetical protein
METAVALMRIIGPVYLITGLSMVIYTKNWSRLLKGFEENHFALVVAAWIGMVFGLLTLNIYNVWDWSLGLIVTLTGWIMLLKGAVYFLAPESFIKNLLRFKQNPLFLYIGAAVITVIGGALSAVAYLG